MDELALKMAIAFAQTRYNHALKENLIPINELEPNDYTHYEFFADLVTNSYQYYANDVPIERRFK